MTRKIVVAVILVLVVAAGVLAYRQYRPRAAAPQAAASAPVAPPPPPPVHDHAAAAAAEPAPTVELSEAEQKAIGVQTVTAKPGVVRGELIASARIEQPESRLSSISARVSGRIEHLYVDYTGQEVTEGAPVATIYSPEVVTAADEFRLALHNRKALDKAEPAVVQGADELVKASRRRLELWGLTPQQIEEISRSSEVKVAIPIYSTTRGVVVERKVTRGQYVKEGDVLYTVADLSEIWAKADVYEFDLPSIHENQRAEITSDALPNRRLAATVVFIEPLVNPETRTTAVHMHLQNPEFKLKPGMFVQAKFSVPAAAPVTVPRTAVLDTGERKYVYVAREDGAFERREVQAGAQGEELTAIRSGLKGGERVVAQGAFMVDSQTRLSTGASGLYSGSKEFGREQAATAAPAPEFAGVKLSLSTMPGEPKASADFMVHLSAKDANGKAVKDGQAEVTFVMPAMPSMGMPEMRANAVLKPDGDNYVGTARLPVAGPYNVNVQLMVGGKVVAKSRTRISAR